MLAFVEVDFARLASFEVFEIVLNRNPIRLVRVRARDDKNDRSVALYPVVQIFLRIQVGKTFARLGCEPSFCRFTLDLNNRVRHFARDIISQLNDAVYSRLHTTDRMPQEAHLQYDALNEIHAPFAGDVAL